MARNESDREDLIREATALVERIELRTDSQEPEVVLGFKRNGALSIYFGADPVYQFDPQHGLRRGYLHGLLYRTQGHTLARLERVRPERQTAAPSGAGSVDTSDVDVPQSPIGSQRLPDTLLIRHDLSPQELADVRQEVSARLHELNQRLNAGRFEITRSVTVDQETLLERIVGFIREVLTRDVPLAPAIPGKK